ncbi:hypothetical protein QMK17_09165 [Rhodococcus sp. G-MC3]|uniref:hypothetical protein n=1 Tax=Rhodococcus sp. G-MC3 TaxID=3046209 RepID=UPI0024B99991|nr:hypothetical protein [Rhodococcus sp. G-MC3]MDJ0393501.1 hypothetical protein [Rhodococcus sp. G-MC3]
MPTDLIGNLGLGGVSPTPIAGSGGCIWGSATFGVGVMLVQDTSFVDDPATNPDVTALEMLSFEDYTTYMFVLYEDTYTTQTMTVDGAVVLNVTVVGTNSMESERQSLVDTFYTFAPYLPPPR